MRKSVRFWKMLSLVGSQLLLAGFGGTCLPDNIFADTGGQIVNGLILSGLNMILAASGLQI
jgi:hypothetical protein